MVISDMDLSLAPFHLFCTGMADQHWTRSAECVRAALTTAALSTLSVFFLFPAILLLRYPESYSQTGLLAQDSVVTLLGSYDTLWYSQSNVSKANSGEGYTAQLFLSNCTDLQPDSSSGSNSFAGSNPSTCSTDGNYVLQELLDLAYMLTGSVLNVTVRISQAPPSGSGSLYLFDNYYDFTSFSNTCEAPSAYTLVYPVALKSNANTSFTFTFNITSFYFLGLRLPAMTGFSYQFSYTRLVYNPASFSAPACNLTLDSAECPIALDGSHRQACILALPAYEDTVTDLLVTLNEYVSRRTWNAVNTFLLVLFACSLMLCISVPTYYWWVLRVRPRLLVWWAHKRRRHGTMEEEQLVN